MRSLLVALLQLCAVRANTKTVIMHSRLIDSDCRAFPFTSDPVGARNLVFPKDILSYASRIDDRTHAVELYDDSAQGRVHKRLLATGESKGGRGTAIQTTFSGYFVNAAQGGWSDCTATVMPTSNTTSRVVCKVNSALSLPRWRWFRDRTTSDIACMGTYAVTGRHLRCDAFECVPLEVYRV